MPCATDAPAPSWRYDDLAAHYERRAPYHPETMRVALRLAGLAGPGGAVDIGSGTGRCAAMLQALGWRVDAVEPCEAMRSLGIAATAGTPVRWHAGLGERTGLPSAAYELVCFGSSFNVVDRDAALAESRRLLRPSGALLCVFNHRELDDPLQAAVQALFAQRLGGYDHGERRGDTGAAMTQGRHFGEPRHEALRFVHRCRKADFIGGFRAHATLVRQAGPRLDALLDELGVLLGPVETVDVPFRTRVWVAHPR